MQNTTPGIAPEYSANGWTLHTGPPMTFTFRKRPNGPVRTFSGDLKYEYGRGFAGLPVWRMNVPLGTGQRLVFLHQAKAVMAAYEVDRQRVIAEHAAVEAARLQIRATRTANVLEQVVTAASECSGCGAPPSPIGQSCRYCGKVAV